MQQAVQEHGTGRGALYDEGASMDDAVGEPPTSQT